MAMKESNLGYAIQMQTNLRYRIEAIVKDRWWDNPAVDPSRPVPIDDLAWAVVANDPIRQTVRDAFASANEPNVGQAVEAITDQQLAPVIYAALVRLGVDEA